MSFLYLRYSGLQSCPSIHGDHTMFNISHERVYLCLVFDFKGNALKKKQKLSTTLVTFRENHFKVSPLLCLIFSLWISFIWSVPASPFLFCKKTSFVIMNRNETLLTSPFLKLLDNPKVIFYIAYVVFTVIAFLIFNHTGLLWDKLSLVMLYAHITR